VNDHDGMTVRAQTGRDLVTHDERLGVLRG
jgi:hypothetical protein